MSIASNAVETSIKGVTTNFYKNGPFTKEIIRKSEANLSKELADVFEHKVPKGTVIALDKDAQTGFNAAVYKIPTDKAKDPSRVLGHALDADTAKHTPQQSADYLIENVGKLLSEVV